VGEADGKGDRVSCARRPPARGRSVWTPANSCARLDLHNGKRCEAIRCLRSPAHFLDGVWNPFLPFLSHPGVNFRRETWTMTSHSFLQSLQAGEVLVADGATGTTLLERGLPRGTPGEAWVLDRPREILGVHRSFIEAGARIVLTCTFGASPVRLRGGPLEDRMAAINRRAVELAREAAADRPVLVGGSIGPSGVLLKPLGRLAPEEASDSFSRQARVLAEAGADLLVIETQYDLAEAALAVQAARSVSSLPVVCTFSFDRGSHTMMGVSPARVGKELESLGADVVGINCGRSLEENLTALGQLRAHCSLPVWFKPNAGLPEVDGEGKARYRTTPEAMAVLVPAWIEAGARVVGGCCGTSPQHLEQIARAVGKARGAAS